MPGGRRLPLGVRLRAWRQFAPVEGPRQVENVYFVHQDKLASA
jgi:hypothetical protein